MKNIDEEIIRGSAYFDAAWYQKTYLGESNVDPAEHYLIVGWLNGYNPSRFFSTYQYLSDYPDVRNSGVNPLVHYERSGKYENRKAVPVKYEHLPVYLKSQKSKIVQIPESAVNERDNIEELVDQLAKQDVVSFDVFDTLILRQVSSPLDIFRIIGMEKGIAKFAQLRQQAEQEAYRTMDPEKVNLRDIYHILAKYITIKDEEAASAYEEDTEYRFCYANPYMKEVTERLKQRHVKMIITSDMYLSRALIERILEHCGYDCFEKIYVSNEIGHTKGNSTLQAYVQNELGAKVKVAHIGDNYQSDVNGSKEAGWSTAYYEQCHQRGLRNRSSLQDTVSLSIYSAVCDNHLLNGLHQYSKEYEHGFLYGGLIAYGYCQWLNALAEKKGIEKIWFFGRDMDVVVKVYQKCFGQYPCEYVKTSRSSAMELTLDQDLEGFIQYSFATRAGKAGGVNTSVGTSLIETGLTSLMPYLKDYSLDKEDILSMEQYEKIRTMVYDHKEEVIQVYAPSVKAAEKYLEEKRGGASRILMVDAGWSGTIFNQFRSFYAGMRPEVQLYGALLGGYRGSSVIDCEEAGFLSVYLFSGTHSFTGSIDPTCNDGWVKANLFESMFTSSERSLIKYHLNDAGQYDFVYSESSNHNEEIIEQIQQGIIDFCTIYGQILSTLHCSLQITGEEAFRPYLTISDDYQYFDRVFAGIRDYKDRLNRLKADDEHVFSTIDDILRGQGLI